MITGFKPLLAATIDPKKEPDVLSRLVFPMSLSPKYDGIRTLPREGVLRSRKYLPLPNPYYQTRFNQPELDGLDTEGIRGDPCDGDDVYNRTQSLIMTGAKNATHADDTALYVFDTTLEEHASLPFYDRLDIARKQVLRVGRSDVIFVEHTEVANLGQFIAYEEKQVAAGFEGVMGRRLNGPYKHGRSTFKEHILLKYKRFEDFEAPIVGFVQALQNTNEATLDAYGHTKRSSAKAGKVPIDRVGKFIVFWEGGTHEVGTGSFKHDELTAIWLNQRHYLGLTMKVRHFPSGAKEGLRHARAVGFRDDIDS